MNLSIKNKEELDGWLFEHAVSQGHPCYGEPEPTHRPGHTLLANRAWVDSITGEEIEIEYEPE
jgi:hypothetical protein